MNGAQRQKGKLLLFLIASLWVMLATISCGGKSTQEVMTMEPKGAEPVSTTEPATGPALSEMGRIGEELFLVNCSVCHGTGATGTNQGPPLIDRVYHPGHHPDFSIRNAVSNGVKQHHWWFGDMPPVAGVSPDEVENLVCYIREVQRAEDIFEGTGFSTVC